LSQLIYRSLQESEGPGSVRGVNAIHFESIPGQVPYGLARDIQLQWLEKRIADRISDTILFFEHTPVVTRGRGLQWNGSARDRHMPIDRSELEKMGIDFEETERGGDLTYHGPGQLVIYPIVKLDGLGLWPQHDLHGFLRGMEKWLSFALKKAGLPAAEQREQATGVWIEDRKIASMGMA
jgi:lipoyl(octanoyl) transferase